MVVVRTVEGLLACPSYPTLEDGDVVKEKGEEEETEIINLKRK